MDTERATELEQETAADSAGDKAVRILPEDYFIMRSDLGPISPVFEAAKKLAGRMQDLGKAFASNLLGVYTTASFVWVFANRTSYQATFTGMLGVEIAVRGGTTPLEELQKEVHEGLQTEKWKPQMESAASTLAHTNLANFLQDKVSRDSATLTLWQGVVLTWTAFEVLASDMFINLVNRNPKLTSALLKDEKAKKLYQPKELLSALEEYEYDLSGHMGEILVEQHRVDSLEAIRVIFDVLFSEHDKLRRRLHDVQLWRLYKTRNLIVHRSGVVDKMFLDSTGLKLEIGEKLRITAGELIAYIALVGEVGIELLQAADSIKA